MNFDDLASIPCSVVNEYMRHLEKDANEPVAARPQE